jgi:hypothetical protein
MALELSVCGTVSDMSEVKVFKVQFYREMLCEVEVQAKSIEDAETFFREGMFKDPRKVPEGEIVDEIVSIEASSDTSGQITFLN